MYFYCHVTIMYLYTLFRLITNELSDTGIFITGIFIHGNRKE